MSTQGPDAKSGFSGSKIDKGQLVDIGQLATGTYLKGKVIWTDLSHPAKFYIQTEYEEDYSSEFSELQVQLQNYYKKACVPDSSPGTNTLHLMIGSCYACYHNDGWCRVVLEQFKEIAKAEVFCIDLGFRNIVNVKKLRFLPTNFLSVPPRATLCQLYGVNDVENRYAAIHMKWLKGKIINMYIQDVFVGHVGRINEGESTLHVTAFLGDSQHSVNNVLSRIIESTPVGNLPSNRTNCLEPESVEWVVKVCHTLDPGKFFVHFKHLAERFKSLQQLLSEQGGTLQEPEELAVGETYVVGIENSWYRGQYLGSFKSTIGPEAESLYEFFLIDKGSDHCASKSSIRMISKEIRDFPAMAFECSLNFETPPDEWPESATMAFIKMVSGRSLVMTVYSENGPSLKVDLAQISSPNCAIAIDSICKVLSTGLKLQIDKSDTSNKSEIQTFNEQHSRDVTELATSAQNAVAQPTQISEFEFTSFTQYLKKQTKVNGSMPGESDFVMAVKFLVCQTPNQIFARPLSYEAKYQKLDTELQKDYRSKQPKFVQPELGMKYSVYLFGHWIRGVVTNIDQDTKQYLIVCMDTGQLFRLGTPLTCPLLPPYDSVPPLAVRFNLSTIYRKPAQSDFDIICRINEVLLGSNEVFVFCQNRPQTIHFKTAVEVIFQQRTSTGTELVNLNEIYP